jgi:hypothetical protein
MSGTFHPSDEGLAYAHSRCQFGLRQSGTEPCADKLGRDFELGRECVVFGSDRRIGEEPGFEFVEWDGHKVSLARRSARSISDRGVAWVFFTNALTPMTRLPRAVRWRYAASANCLGR